MANNNQIPTSVLPLAPLDYDPQHQNAMMRSLNFTLQQIQNPGHARMVDIVMTNCPTKPVRDNGTAYPDGMVWDDGGFLKILPDGNPGDVNADKVNCNTVNAAVSVTTPDVEATVKVDTPTVNATTVNATTVAATTGDINTVNSYTVTAVTSVTTPVVNATTELLAPLVAATTGNITTVNSTTVNANYVEAYVQVDTPTLNATNVNATNVNATNLAVSGTFGAYSISVGAGGISIPSGGGGVYAPTGYMTTYGMYMIGLPTTDPHSAGQVWNSSGTLKISAG